MISSTSCALEARSASEMIIASAKSGWRASSEVTLTPSSPLPYTAVSTPDGLSNRRFSSPYEEVHARYSGKAATAAATTTEVSRSPFVIHWASQALFSSHSSTSPPHHDARRRSRDASKYEPSSASTAAAGYRDPTESNSASQRKPTQSSTSSSRRAAVMRQTSLERKRKQKERDWACMPVSDSSLLSPDAPGHTSCDYLAYYTAYYHHKYMEESPEEEEGREEAVSPRTPFAEVESFSLESKDAFSCISGKDLHVPSPTQLYKGRRKAGDTAQHLTTATHVSGEEDGDETASASRTNHRVNDAEKIVVSPSLHCSPILPRAATTSVRSPESDVELRRSSSSLFVASVARRRGDAHTVVPHHSQTQESPSFLPPSSRPLALQKPEVSNLEHSTATSSLSTLSPSTLESSASTFYYYVSPSCQYPTLKLAERLSCYGGNSHSQSQKHREEASYRKPEVKFPSQSCAVHTMDDPTRRRLFPGTSSADCSVSCEGVTKDEDVQIRRVFDFSTDKMKEEEGNLDEQGEDMSMLEVSALTATANNATRPMTTCTVACTTPEGTREAIASLSFDAMQCEAQEKILSCPRCSHVYEVSFKREHRFQRQHHQQSMRRNNEARKKPSALSPPLSPPPRLTSTAHHTQLRSADGHCYGIHSNQNAMSACGGGVGSNMGSLTRSSLAKALPTHSPTSSVPHTLSTCCRCCCCCCVSGHCTMANKSCAISQAKQQQQRHPSDPVNRVLHAVVECGSSRRRVDRSPKRLSTF